MSQEDDYRRIEQELKEAEERAKAEAPKTQEELLEEQKDKMNRTLGEYLNADVLELYRERAARKAIRKRERDKTDLGLKISIVKGAASELAMIGMIGVVIFLFVIFFQAMKGMMDRTAQTAYIDLSPETETEEVIER